MAAASTGAHLNQVEGYFRAIGLTATAGIPQTLTWAQENIITTPSSWKFKGEHAEVHFEVARFATRIHLLRFLLDGNYAAFIKGSPEPIISKTNFARLSAIIQAVEGREAAMIAAQAIAAVPLSPQAKREADARDVTYPYDSVQFSATTVKGCPDIYPAYGELDDSDKTIIHAAFPLNTHFRHMLFVEGNAGMFTELQKGISDGSVTQEHFDFWAAYWLVNLVGFSVTKDASLAGTAYCNDHLAEAALTLIDCLQTLFTDPSADTLAAYLGYRASLVGFDPASPEGRLKAQYACMLDIFTEDEKTAAISAAVDTYLASLDDDTRARVLGQFEADQATSTPTYKPALLKNIFAITGDIGLAVTLTLQIAQQAELEAHREARLIVSYRIIAGKDKAIPELLRQYEESGRVTITVNELGEIPPPARSATPLADASASAGTAKPKEPTPP